MTQPPKKRRKFKGYAVLNRDGKLIWGTIRTKKEEAQKLYDQWNPDPEGQGSGAQLVELDIYIGEQI